MYSVVRNTYNSNSGAFEMANWMYNMNGYKCLVEFPGGAVRNPYSSELLVREGDKEFYTR